jgi:hypothetical protein
MLKGEIPIAVRFGNPDGLISRFQAGPTPAAAIGVDTRPFKVSVQGEKHRRSDVRAKVFIMFWVQLPTWVMAKGDIVNIRISRPGG